MGSHHQVTRRALLRLGGRAVIAVTASSLFSTPYTAAAGPIARRLSWEQRDLALTDAPLLSPPLDCDFPFNAVESRWVADVPDGAALALSIRVRDDANDWGDWIPLHADDHAPDDADTAPFGDLVIVAPAVHLQYRIEASANADGDLPVLHLFAITAVDTLTDDPSAATTHIAAAGGVKIISRAGWGADERLRVDKDGKQIWPPEYRPIKKVVIHHTVTADPDPSPKATIRAIYQYHAVTRGWGDIGYNFLIDPNGVIYEGRYGGDGVIGGHTYGYNEGSMGIAMLGTYSGHTISAATRTALKALIKAKVGDLDPMGKSFFVDRDNVWNITGHRSLTETDCPGDTFYPTFNNLRRELKGLPLWTGAPSADPLAANPPDAAAVPKSVAPPSQVAESAPQAPAQTTTMRATLTSVAWPAGSVYSRDLVPVRLTIKNMGTATLTAGKPAPSFVYTEGESYATKSAAIARGAFNIAIGPAAKPNGPPYRWLPERDIRPGEAATITVAMRLRTVQETPFIVTLRREGYSILDQNDSHTVTVIANPADPVPATQAKEGMYVPETKHTVSGTILVYWQQNGGAGLFGLPLTEPFAERNADDGKTYTVQYFERARFELHPDQENAERVELGLLGKLAAKGREQEGPFKRITATSTASRRFFPEVGHTLSGTFKEYWDGHGGLAVFGLPISEPFDEKSATDGKTYRVQYFERNRFELHGGTGDAGSVSLGLLGSEALRQRGWLG